LSREEHSELLNEQRVTLFKALCLLPEVQRSVELERLQHGERHRSPSPERQLIAGEKSRAFDVIWNKTKRLFPIDGTHGENSERLVRQIWRLLSVNEKASKLTKPKELIYWLEDGETGQSLCAIPNNVNELLYRQQWSKGISTVLTSGTLSADGDFTRTKQTLGLDRLGERISETSKPSPFNYRDNALLYISKNVPYPSQRSERYIAAITD
jgi:ATP-dependent DNA helicase DinG